MCPGSHKAAIVAKKCASYCDAILTRKRKQISMTIDSHRVAQLLVEVGERTSRIDSIVQQADAPRWAIELEDGSAVLAELDEERGRLSLETDLGRPPEARRLATCEALMMLTSLEHASHDWAMALSEPEGEFQLCGHIAMPPADALDLQTTLFAFVDQAQHWREVVSRGAQSEVEEAQELSPDLLI